MHLSNELGRMLAEHTYESTRLQFRVVAPEMKPWDGLSEDEQAQCRDAMRLWLAGLGSNEVGEEWFNRSGRFPRALWDQVPNGPSPTIFIMAALEMLERVLALAELGLKKSSEE